MSHRHSLSSYRGGLTYSQLQSLAIVDFWDGAVRTVVLGDLSAVPDAPEMETCDKPACGCLAGMGLPPVHTLHSVNPCQRIDTFETAGLIFV